MNAFYDLKIVPQAIAPAADGETIRGAGVDMQGFQGGVTFLACAQKGEALDWALSVEEGADAGFADATAVIDPATGQALAVAFSTTVDADGYACVEIARPQGRYLRPVLTVPDAAAPKAIALVAMQTEPRRAPVANPGAFVLSPDRV